MLHTLRSHTKINKAEPIWCPFWNVILADQLCLTHLRICPLGHHFPISCFNRTPKWAFVYHELIVLSCSSTLLEAPCSPTVIPSSCFPHVSIITKKPSQNTHSSWSKLQELMEPPALHWCGQTEHITWLWHHIVTERGNSVLRWDWQLPPSLSSSCVMYDWKGTAVSINKTQKLWSRPGGFVPLMEQVTQVTGRPFPTTGAGWRLWGQLPELLSDTSTLQFSAEQEFSAREKYINRWITYSAKLRIIWTNLAT